MKALIIVAALGYFVDVYDLILFSVVRMKSLESLGLSGPQILEDGIFLLNMQMIGMLFGGMFWGILGDKKGRVSVLFGSILLYSLANVANGFVESVNAYAFWRLIAGIGLAGELGAGITLVAESLPREKRGLGTTIVATVGVMGAVVAALVGKYFDWRTAYFIGGGLGLALLLLRVAVHESGMFNSISSTEVRRGNFFLLFQERSRCWRYLCSIMSGLPIWYVVGVLVTFSPEIGKALELEVIPEAGTAVFYCYVGLIFGDLASGLLSQLMKSRKTVMLIFICMAAILSEFYLRFARINIDVFYYTCLALGFAVGYWAIFVTNAAEQFGTNLRATVATTAPNFVRGAVVLLTYLFHSMSKTMGIIGSARAVAIICFAIAIASTCFLKDNFSKDLDYLE